MPSPTLCSFQGQLFNTAGGAVAGANITVLTGQVDTVNVTNQPGSPLAHVYADPYGYSEIPQAPVNLSGNVSTTAGSPNVSYSSGSQLSAFLVGLIIVINGVQYTVQSVNPTAGTLVLATNAQSTGTFAWSVTIPVTQISAVPGFGVTDGEGNFQFWAAAGYYVLQIYDQVMPQQFIQGITIGSVSGGGGGGIGPVGTGNGASGQIMLTTLKGSGGGPANPAAVVGYAQVTIGATTYWVPLFQ